MTLLNKILFIAVALFSFNTFATVDGFTEAWIVVEDFNEEDRFFVQKVPVIGCYGLPQGPQVVQFVSEYKVKSSLGCGDDSEDMMNINALSCATLEDSIEDDAFMAYKKVVLNISKCPQKNNSKFIRLEQLQLKTFLNSKMASMLLNLKLN